MDRVIRFHLNDELIEERAAPPTSTLLWWLRRERHLTGTKEGCAEGDCGACTVAVVDRDLDGRPTFRAVNACLVLLPTLHGRRVYTVEGLVTGGEPHPVQRVMTDALASQCGYCTPGFVMSMFAGTYRADLGEPWQRDDQLAGNLCRCTGYRPLREAFAAVAGTRPDDHFRATLEATPTDPLPALAYEAAGQRFFAPTSLDDLFDLLDAHPEHRMVAGATDLGLDVTKRRARLSCLVSLDRIPDLGGVAPVDGGWSIGATVRLSDLEAAAAQRVPPLTRMLRFFGARQIKNRATLGGNLCNASPIGDTPPVLLALGAVVVARSRAGERRVPIEGFFEAYRQTALRPGEVLARVEVPELPMGARAAAYKVSKRRELDISTVAAGMVVLTDADEVVTEARLGFGGMAATPSRAAAAEAALTGRRWDAEAVEAAAAALEQDFTPIDDHRGTAWYRMTVAKNLLRGFYEETREVRVRPLPDVPAATVLAEVTP